MAKLCFICGSLCAYLVLFLRICSASSSPNSEYFYQSGDSHQRLQDRLDVRLLQDEEARVRRDLPLDYASLDRDKLMAKNGTSLSTDPSVSINSKVKPSVPLNVSKIYLKDNQTAPLDSGYSVDKKKTPVSLNTTPPAPPATHGVAPTKNPSSIPEATQALNITKSSSPLPPKNNSSNNTTNEPSNDAEVDYRKFGIDVNNKTLQNHNITMSRTDKHFYYTSTFKIDADAAQHFWVNLTEKDDVKVNELLSSSHRRAASIKLSFEFPFYGHLIKTVTIATGGFLYTGDYVHYWLAATQYIAPLMANFDTSLSNHSNVKYFDNGTAFTVEWERVQLQDKPDEGEFTFQATLHKNGDIVFVYKLVPEIIESIHDDYHPVKIGLSDAYIIDKTIFYVRRKTIYEYHRVNFKKEDIQNNTVIFLKAQPTCLINKDCNSCLTSNITDFVCLWCPNASRCSNGVDRHRQDWVSNSCETLSINNVSGCSTKSNQHPNGDSIYNNNADIYRLSDDKPSAQETYIDKTLVRKEPVKMGVSGVVAILFLVAMISGLVVWVFYAYRNPHTASGQILIRYRPSQWRWRRGEARYTAATIHM